MNHLQPSKLHLFEPYPSLQNTFPCKRAFRFTLALKMLPFGKYLTLNTLYNKVSLLCNNLHTCLAKKTSLNCLKSLKPIPLTYFENHKVLHLTQWALLDFSWCPYQNFLIIASIDIEVLLFFFLYSSTLFARPSSELMHFPITKITRRDGFSTKYYFT